MRNLFIVIGMIVTAAATSAADRHRAPEQDGVRDALRAGNVLPFGEMRARAQERVGGRMIGSEFDPGTGRYRFKFQRGNSVIWLDMDGRTGRELGRVGD